MSARDDYPLLAYYDREEHSAGRECEKALNEIDRLRALVMSKDIYITTLEYQTQRMDEIIRQYDASA